MALPCGPAIAETYSRARDPHQTGTDHSFVRNLLDRLQAIVNCSIGAVLQSLPFTTTPRQVAYGVSLNNIGVPVGIRDDNQRDLDPIDPTGLRWINENWWREVGPQLRSWCRIGDDLMIIRPALLAPMQVTVRHRAITDPLNADVDLFNVPDENIRLIIMAGEALLLLKSRDMEQAAVAWQNFVTEVKVITG